MNLSNKVMVGETAWICLLMSLALGLVMGDGACERGRSWWHPQRGLCVPCTRCDPRRLAVKYPCEVHRDTICQPLYEVRIWPFNTQKDSNDSSSDYEYYEYTDYSEVSDKEPGWDIQTSTLTLAISGCIVFFIVVLTLSLYHAKQWRVIKQALKSDLYQETCLVQNPFFTVVDMDCWPCSMVNNIGEVYDPQPVNKQHNAPFIYKTEQPEINIDTLHKLYTDNTNTFQKENSKVFVDNQYHQPLSSIFNNGDNYFVWKINSINEARIVRKIITRPKVVPKFGQSIERFIIIDSKHSSFQIPDTECNYSFLLAVSGTRMIDLKPAEECKHQCKSFKIELKESYLLWYNWWYWRPYVNKSSSNKTFIAHVGSYC